MCANTSKETCSLCSSTMLCWAMMGSGDHQRGKIGSLNATWEQTLIGVANYNHMWVWIALTHLGWAQFILGSIGLGFSHGLCYFHCYTGLVIHLYYDVCLLSVDVVQAPKVCLTKYLLKYTIFYFSGEFQEVLDLLSRCGSWYKGFCELLSSLLGIFLCGLY